MRIPFFLSVSVSRETFIRKDAGIENSGIDRRSGLVRIGFAGRNSVSGDRSSRLRRLPLGILPQTQRQYPAPDKIGGVPPTKIMSGIHRQFYFR
jgi:hypothetical protein